MYRKLCVTIAVTMAALGLSLGVAWAAPVIMRGGNAPAVADSSAGILPGVAGLAETTPITPTGTVTPTGGVSNTGQAKIAAAVAKEFGVTVTDVLAVRAQGYGWGEVFKVYLYAKESGKTPAEIIALRGTEGWGVLAKSLGLTPGLGKDNLGQALKNQRLAGQLTPTPAATATAQAAPSGRPANPSANGGGRGNGNGGNNGNGNGNGKKNK